LLSFRVINEVLFLMLQIPTMVQKPLLGICFFLVLLGCTNQEKLTYELTSIKEQACESCPTIDIQVPKILDETPLASLINKAITEEISAQLVFEESSGGIVLENAIASFNEGFEAVKRQFEDQTIPWEATLSGDIVYEDAQMVTVVINSYLFTGGAHGNSDVSYLNFDKVTGTEIENWELFDDEEGFTHYAETKFRIQEKVPQDDSINQTGFMFEAEVFHLSENIGYTPDGVQLLYNPYEIASFAEGPIVLTIPFQEANKYLKRKPKS